MRSKILYNMLIFLIILLQFAEQHKTEYKTQSRNDMYFMRISCSRFKQSKLKTQTQNSKLKTRIYVLRYFLIFWMIFGGSLGGDSFSQRISKI